MTTRGFMPQLSHNARQLSGAALRAEMSALRAQVQEFVKALPDEALLPERIATVNPPLWECAHVAWFAEWWCLRAVFDATTDTWIASRPSARADADLILNSNVLPHDARWNLPQLDRAATLEYMDTTHARVLAALDVAAQDNASLYPFRLALFHEAMHLEALAWCAQTLGWAKPGWVRSLREVTTSGTFTGPASTLTLGHDGEGFSFDNERDAFTASIRSFEIDRSAVTHAQFLRFVESGQYLARTGRAHPEFWRRIGTSWEMRSFDQWIALPLAAPMVHVNAPEAEAYCDWVGRRLPSEQEWETAARMGAIEWGDNVWEWTATDFAPYDGFTPDRYREYSAPWFDGAHRVLRGGSFATLDLMHNVAYRNFFQPHRSDVFAGFRTCAV
jgi:gamma-glutamyl hercynylcysteine S-oxide synthase